MNKSPTSSSGESGRTQDVEHRQEERLRVNIPGEIQFIDKAGHLLVEDIWIEDYSDAGCGFAAGIPLKAGDIVAIKPLLADEQTLRGAQLQLFEIASTDRKAALWAAGAKKLQGRHHASIKFPPSTHNPKRSSK